MAATAELFEVSRSIRSALGESAGNFRKAANDNNAVIGKLNRDLGKYFSSMRSQLSEISETNSEIAQNTEKMVSRTDRFISLLSESLNIQNQLFNEKIGYDYANKKMIARVFHSLNLVVNTDVFIDKKKNWANVVFLMLGEKRPGYYSTIRTILKDIKVIEYTLRYSKS